MSRTPRQALHALILTLPGVVDGKSRFGGAVAFTVERREFAHFHSDTEIDVRLPRRHQQALPEPLAAIARPNASSHWLPLPVTNNDEVTVAFQLVQAAYRATL